MELKDYVSVLVAVLIFFLGFLLSQHIEKRTNRKQRVKESVEAIVPFLAAWQHELSDLINAEKSFGTNSPEYNAAYDQFKKASSIAIALEMHVSILRHFGECNRLVSLVERLFGGRSGMHIDETVGMHIRHGMHINLVEIALKKEAETTIDIEKFGNWATDAIFKDFQEWSRDVQLECATVLSQF